MAPQAKKKIGYGVKMLVYNHTVTQQTLFCGAKKENGAAGKKKNKGYGTSASAAGSIIPVIREIWGSAGEGPKSAQKSPLFFFFFPPQKSRIMRCRIIRYMELFPCFEPNKKNASKMGYASSCTHI